MPKTSKNPLGSATDPASTAPFAVSSTLIFPLSGNPVGFNHHGAVELLLRLVPALERVLFVLSNGRHPDPTKPDAEVDAAARLELLEAASAAIDDPRRSYLAFQAQLAGERLRLTRERIAVSTLELKFDRAVRTAELLPLLREQADDPSVPFQWLAGSDLIRRMADSQIFSDADLQLLADNCHYHILEREGDPACGALEKLRERRGIDLSCDVHDPQSAPPWLSPFLALSSTAIRNAAEAGERLASLLPAPAAEIIATRQLYAGGRPAQRIVDLDGHQVAVRSELAVTLDKLLADLLAEANALADLLRIRAAAGRPHRLSVAETSAGGLITAALATIPGASAFFAQSRFVYDNHAKASLLGAPLRGPAVERETVAELSAAMARAAQTDFALAESGMAGPPDPSRRSLKSGHCWLTCTGPSGTQAEEVRFSPWLTRREHQFRFAIRALSLARTVVSSTQ